MALDKQTLKQLTACLSYGTVSVSMTLFNKAVFSIYQFNFPSFGACSYHLTSSSSSAFASSKTSANTAPS